MIGPKKDVNLNQFTELRRHIENDEAINAHFAVDWDRLENWITDGRRRLIYSLIINKKRFELNRILSQVFKRR